MGKTICLIYTLIFSLSYFQPSNNPIVKPNHLLREKMMEWFKCHAYILAIACAECYVHMDC